MKQKLWAAIEAYRSSGGREEHRRNQDILDVLINRSENIKAAYDTWQEKTEWVQETAVSRELGKHRADVLRERIENLKLELADLKAAASREVAGRRGKSVVAEIIVLKIVASNFKDEDIVRTGREMSHNLTGNGFLFLDEAQLIGFARVLMARALGQ